MTIFKMQIFTEQNGNSYTIYTEFLVTFVLNHFIGPFLKAHFLLQEKV